MTQPPPFSSFEHDGWQVVPSSRIPPDLDRPSAWFDLHMGEFRHDRRHSFRHGLHRRRFEPCPDRAYFWTRR